jgi:predicted dithiol-disulfide oxidoreductase (DUF899 family)
MSDRNTTKTHSAQSADPASLATHPAVSQEEWIIARKKLLEREKAHTREADEIARQRRALPWVKITKNYTFQGSNGPVTLADLFQGKSQLILNHFMFGPGWGEGCPGCSLGADHVAGPMQHLRHHDVAYAAVSRAPLGEITPYQKRMGWDFLWVSSHGGDFNYDFHVTPTAEEQKAGKAYYNYEVREVGGIDELPGISIFYKNPQGEIFHTYSTFGRGGEKLGSVFTFQDILPKGRDETGPGFNLTDWVRRHDRYDAPGTAQQHWEHHKQESDSCCHPEAKA